MFAWHYFAIRVLKWASTASSASGLMCTRRILCSYHSADDILSWPSPIVAPTKDASSGRFCCTIQKRSTFRLWNVPEHRIEA